MQPKTEANDRNRARRALDRGEGKRLARRRGHVALQVDVLARLHGARGQRVVARERAAVAAGVVGLVADEQAPGADALVADVRGGRVVAVREAGAR